MTMHAIARHWLSLNWQYIGQSVRKLAFPLTFLWLSSDFPLSLHAATSWGAKHLLSLSPGSHAIGLCLFGWPASTHLGWPRNFSDRHQPRLCLGKKWDKTLLRLDFLGLSSNCGSHPTPSSRLSLFYWVSRSYLWFIRIIAVSIKPRSLIFRFPFAFTLYWERTWPLRISNFVSVRALSPPWPILCRYSWRVVLTRTVLQTDSLII